jgi:trans-2,3-dihydro-3-hydroxyanthranilate isomerase
MRYRYATLDVFTQTRLAGNPLAVVFDADGIAPEQMQAIAREFNLSETVFLLTPENPIHKAKLRIFTPGRELPFAGHPTVGTAVLLGLRAETPLDAQAFGLEEGVGTVPCVVETRGERAGYARFRLPRLPEVIEGAPEAVDAAWGLGIDPAEIGFDLHMPSRHSAGNPFDFVPVASLDAIARAKPQGEAFDKAFGANHPGVYVYCRETTETGRHFHARMFGSRSSGIYEDPATGSAVAAFAGVLMQFEPMGEGEHSFLIEQGYEMGRPSEIDLQIVIGEGALQSAEIGGHAVMVSEGEIEV